MIKNFKLRKETLSQIEKESLLLASTHVIISDILDELTDCILQFSRFDRRNLETEFELWSEFYAWELYQGDIRSRIRVLDNKMKNLRGF